MANWSRLRISALLLLVAFSVAFVCPPFVEATPAARIVLDYNEETEVLFVNVTHQVPNPKNHYIGLIEVFRNSALQINRTYPEQEFGFGRNDTFVISASSGDNLTVTATCSRGYSLSAWIIVSASSATGSATTTSGQTNTQSTTPPDGIEPLDPSIGISVGLVAATSLVIVLVLYKEGYVSQLAQRLRP